MPPFSMAFVVFAFDPRSSRCGLQICRHFQWLSDFETTIFGLFEESGVLLVDVD
jgi:hypothetical protein